MANNLSGISYTNNFNNLDGLSIVQADQIYVDGTSIDPTNLVPYTGASKTTDLGSQNIKTTRNPTANADLTNKLYVDSAVTTGSGDTLSIVNLNFVRYSGSISDTDLGTYKISSSAVPTTANHLTNKTYVDGAITTATSNKVPYTGGTANVVLTGTNQFQQSYNATVSDTTTVVNRQTLDSAISSASLLPLNNVWTGTNSFTNTVTLSPATATATYTLGINASNQIVKYTPSSGIGGSVTSGYIPYASAANTLADSLLYKSGNNTGIGTTSPAGRFTIYATSAADADRLSSLVIDTYRAGIRLTSNGTAGCDWNFWVSTAGESPPQDALCFYNQGTSKFRMVLTRNGALGIGTENPLCSLYVFSSATTGWAGQSYFGNATSGVIAGTYDNVSYIGGHNGALSAWKDLAINASGGNVAVGRITASYKLHVEGTIAGQAILSLFPALNGGAGSNITMTAGNGAFGTIEAYNTANTAKLPLCLNPYGGNVAVGTTTPTGKLTVYSSTADYTNSLVVNTAWPSITLDGTGTTLRSWSILNGGSGSGVGQGNFGIYDITAGAYRLSIRSSGSVGLGRITADLCVVESQTSTLTACAQFYITPGPATTFYPVVFNTNPAHDTGQNTYKITIARTSVHQDATWRGSLMAEFWGNSSIWGNGADSFSYNIAGVPSGGTYNYMVGNAYVDFTSGWLVVYLRGGSTYQYSCVGASLNYYPTTSPFVSYTIPVGAGTVLYATNTPTAPFNNTYLQYDSFTGLSTYNSASYGTVSSPLINRVGGGVKLSLIPTNGDPEYGFASYQTSGNAGGTTYCNAISNTPVTDYNPGTWSAKGYTLFTPTTDPAPNKCSLGIGSAGNGGYGVYGDNYITSLTPGIIWTNLWISAHQTLIRYDGNLVAYSVAGGWVSVSDEREKTEIKDLKTGRSLERILACKPKFYKRKIYEKEDGTPVSQSTKEAVHIGLLAQDVLQHNPHCVSTWENTQTDDEDKSRYGVNYNDYTVHLIGAVQEQQKQIDVLKQELAKSQQEFQAERDLLLHEVKQGQEAQRAYDDLKEQLAQSQKDLEDYKALTEERFNKLVALIQKK